MAVPNLEPWKRSTSSGLRTRSRSPGRARTPPARGRGPLRDPRLDPLYVANEGNLIVIVPPEHADAILTAMQSHPLGEVGIRQPGIVHMRTCIGSARIVDMPAGDQLRGSAKRRHSGS